MEPQNPYQPHNAGGPTPSPFGPAPDVPQPPQPTPPEHHEPFRPSPQPPEHPQPIAFGAQAPPANPKPQLVSDPVDPVRPIPVVKVLSPRGVEYVLLTICLFIGAGSFMGVLVSLIYGSTDFGALSFPVAALLVTVPIFAYLFLRLKKAELANPDLKLDQSKRRSTQFTQIIAFLVALFALIGMIYSVFSAISGEETGSLAKSLGSSFVVLLVTAGVFAYYWIDEHKN